MCQRDLHLPRGMQVLQGFWSRWDTSLPSRLTSEHRLHTLRSQRQWELQSNNRKGLRGAGREGQLQEGGPGLLGSSPSKHTQRGASIFKLKRKKKSSFQLQTGQTVQQSNYIPPLSILPTPAAGDTGTTGSV